MQKCIDALKLLFKDLDARVTDLETNLCSKIETCIRTNTNVQDAIIDLITSLLPGQFTCADVANCINNNTDVRNALNNRLSSNTDILNTRLNGSNFLPNSGVRDKIANAKFSAMTDGTYSIQKIGGIYNLVPGGAVTSDCVPIPGDSNRETITKPRTTNTFPSGTNPCTQFTIVNTGHYSINTDIQYSSASGGTKQYRVRKLIAGIPAADSSIVVPAYDGILLSHAGIFNTNNGLQDISVPAEINCNAGDTYVIEFTVDTNNGTGPVTTFDYSTTISYDCGVSGNII